MGCDADCDLSRSHSRSPSIFYAPSPKALSPSQPIAIGNFRGNGWLGREGSNLGMAESRPLQPTANAGGILLWSARGGLRWAFRSFNAWRSFTLTNPSTIHFIASDIFQNLALNNKTRNL